MVVFASLDEANPCSLSDATARRTLLFRLDGGNFGDGRRVEQQGYSTPHRSSRTGVPSLSSRSPGRFVLEWSTFTPCLLSLRLVVLAAAGLLWLRLSLG